MVDVCLVTYPTVLLVEVMEHVAAVLVLISSPIMFVCYVWLLTASLVPRVVAVLNVILDILSHKAHATHLVLWAV